MTEWSVTLGFAHHLAKDTLTDRIDDLLEAMAPYHAAASFDAHGVSVQFTVEAASVGKAIDAGLTVLLKALQEVGIKADGIFGAQAQTMEHLAAEQDLPNYPDLIGVAELAEILGVSRQRASELARTGSGFPRPLRFLASGPIWDKAMIARYVQHWDRRPRGRPKKAAQVSAYA